MSNQEENKEITNKSIWTNKKQLDKQNKVKEGSWAKIPKSVWLECTRVQTCVYAAISMLQGGNEYTWAGLDVIASHAGYSPSATDRAIRDLLKLGWIGRNKQFGKPSKLFIYIDVIKDDQVRKEYYESKKQASKEFIEKMKIAKDSKNKLTNLPNLSGNEKKIDSSNLDNTFPPNLDNAFPPNLSESNIQITITNNNYKEQPSEPSPAILITRDEELTGNTLGVGSMSNSIIKENIYKYLHSKQIPIVPGSDIQAIEKHKYSPEFVYKIQRLEKLHFIVKNWRDYQNKLDPKVHVPKLLELETTSGTISWALSNHSTDVDPYYNLIESFVRRREEERRHKEAEEARKEAERQEFYRQQRENQTFEQPDNRTVYEKLEEKRKERAQESAIIEEEPKTERLTPDEQIRLRDLMIRGRMSLEEQLEYKSLIERNRK